MFGQGQGDELYQEVGDTGHLGLFGKRLLAQLHEAGGVRLGGERDGGDGLGAQRHAL